MKKAGVVSGLSPSTQSVRLRLGFLLLRLLRGFRPIEQLHQRHRRVVAFPESVLQDTQVSPVSLRVARSELGEELGHDATVAQAVESEAPVSEARLLDRKSTRLNSSHLGNSYAVFCLNKKKNRASSQGYAALCKR